MLSLEKMLDVKQISKNRGSKINYGPSIANHFVEEHLMTWENAHENDMWKKWVKKWYVYVMYK